MKLGIRNNFYIIPQNLNLIPYLCTGKSYTASSYWTPPGPEGSKGRWL